MPSTIRTNTRGYNAKINSYGGRFRSGYGGGRRNRGNKRFSPAQVLIGGTDRLKDQQKYADCPIKLSWKGTNAAPTVLTTADSGLSDPTSGTNPHDVKALTMNASGLNGVLIEPMKFVCNGETRPTIATFSGKNGYLKHVNLDLSISAIQSAATEIKSCEVVITLVKLLGDNTWLESNNVNLHSFDLNHSGSSRVFKLMEKRFCIAPNQPPVKIKLFRAFNQMIKNPVESTAAVPMDRQMERVALIIKSPSYDSMTSVLQVCGFFNTFGYEA